MTTPIRADDLERTPLLTLAERYLDLEIREFVARYAAADHHRPPLTSGEHLELLATAEAIRRQVSHGRQLEVYRARQAGASWAAIADATGAAVPEARRAFLDWIDGQVRLWNDTPAGCTAIGLGPDARPAAYRLAADDPADLAGITEEAGPDRKEVPNPR